MEDQIKPLVACDSCPSRTVGAILYLRACRDCLAWQAGRR